MKRATVVVIAMALIFWAVPAVFAQHGQGAMGGGHSMGQGAGSHGANASQHQSQHQGGAKTPTQMLADNPKLADKLKPLLPAGMDAQQACSGFKNMGQCVAALHVSQNLHLSFTELKDKMLGVSTSTTTSTAQPMSLGKAIQTLAPTADAKAAAKKAQQQADDDLKG